MNILCCISAILLSKDETLYLNRRYVLIKMAIPFIITVTMVMDGFSPLFYKLIFG